MAAPSLNGVAVPTSMSTRGRYLFHPQRAGGTNGNGIAQAAGPQFVTWEFSFMTATEFEWWYANASILNGALSVTLSAAELKDNRQVDRTFVSGTLYRPIEGLWTGGLHHNVSILISHLLPIF